jgi:hypothetical protein
VFTIYACTEEGEYENKHLTTHTSLSPTWRGFAPGFVNYKNVCTRFAAASDKVYYFLAHGRWFSPGTPASSTTKTGRHDIAEILLKVAAMLVIGLYELLGNPTTYLIEPPGPSF